MLLPPLFCELTYLLYAAYHNTPIVLTIHTSPLARVLTNNSLYYTPLPAGLQCRSSARPVASSRNLDLPGSEIPSARLCGEGRGGEGDFDLDPLVVTVGYVSIV